MGMWKQIAELTGATGAQGLQGAPGETVPWKPNTNYLANQLVIAPNGDPVRAKAAFTSGATYDPTKWNSSVQDGRIGTVEAATTSQAIRLDNVEVFTPYTVPDAGAAIMEIDLNRRRNEREIGPDGCVPDWVLQRWANRWPSSNGRVKKILIVAGQSNSIFRFNTDGPKLSDADSRIKWWNRLAGVETELSPNVTPSIASAFAQRYLQDFPNTDILIVPVTVGSTGFRTSSISPAPSGYGYSSGGTWDRTLTADPNNLAQRLFDSLAGARTFTSNAPVIAMLWSQGESDRGRLTESEYAALFDDLIGQIRTQVSQSDLPVILAGFTPEEVANPQQAGTEPILRALENTQARLFNTAYVFGPANHLQYNEQIHWSPEGNQNRGKVMATDGLRRARLNLSGGLPYSPRNVTITRTGNTALIGWDYPLGRATSFTLETSTDNGTTWTPQTLAGPLVTTHTMTAAAGTALWARVKTTNETGTSYPTMEAKA